jgi:hypothetical protein
MESRTRSNSLRGRGNPRAVASVLVGLLGLLAIPAGIVVSRYSDRVTLVNSAYGSIPVGLLLGSSAYVLAKRARELAVWTLRRGGAETAARAGRVLAVLAVCVALTAALAIGFYGLLTLFAE